MPEPPEREVLPVPLSETESGVWLLLSVIVQLADSDPVILGWKATAETQLADAASVDPQLVEVIVKSPAFAPVMEAALRVTEFGVLLVTVIVCEALAVPMLTVP